MSEAKASQAGMYIFMGGTFDPIHKGHLRGALHVSALFNNALVHLLPTKVPVHKALPAVSNAQRLEMLAIATQHIENIAIDLRELEAQTESYTIATLQALREQLGADTVLIMVIGMDSFATLPSWLKYQQFLDLCHILVLQRPQYSMKDSDKHQQLLQHRVHSAAELSLSGSGKLYFFEQPATDISASTIRRQLQQSKKSDLLPEGVADYIDQHRLYQDIKA